MEKNTNQNKQHKIENIKIRKNPSNNPRRTTFYSLMGVSAQGRSSGLSTTPT